MNYDQIIALTQERDALAAELAQAKRHKQTRGAALDEAHKRIGVLEAALRKIITDGNYTAPEGMKAMARSALETRPEFDPAWVCGVCGKRHGPDQCLGAETSCEACEGSGETGHTHTDGTQYSDRNPPCVECGGTGKRETSGVTPEGELPGHWKCNDCLSFSPLAEHKCWDCGRERVTAPKIKGE